MIRTKEQLVKAIDGGKLLNCQSGTRPSAPWKYEVDGVTAHGKAFRSAEKAGLFTFLVRYWNHSTYRVKHAHKATA